MSFLSALNDLLHPAPPPGPDVRKGIERIGELVDPTLQFAPDLSRTLADPVAHALGYCRDLVDRLPGPIDINHQAFASDPLVHALFASADDILHMLGRSQAVRDYLETIDSLREPYFYAMLAARRREKHQLGFALQGDVIRSEVPQTAVYFSDHVVTALDTDLLATRERLQASAFDSLLKTFQDHVAALRHEKESILIDCSLERAAYLQGEPAFAGIGAWPHTRRLDTLNEHLREVAAALAPEQLETALANFLRAPEISLRLDPVTLRLDRQGILLDSSDDGPGVADTVRFPELSGRDQRRHMVILARIDCAEARQAVAETRDAQRRFLVL